MNLNVTRSFRSNWMGLNLWEHNLGQIFKKEFLIFCILFKQLTAERCPLLDLATGHLQAHHFFFLVVHSRTPLADFFFSSDQKNDKFSENFADISSKITYEKKIEFCETLWGSVFFFPVKIKSARESPFLLFLRFFSRVEIRFHAHFFEQFHGQSRVFTGSI